jgi:hypothetical protein
MPQCRRWASALSTTGRRNYRIFTTGTNYKGLQKSASELRKRDSVSGSNALAVGQ